LGQASGRGKNVPQERCKRGGWGDRTFVKIRKRPGARGTTDVKKHESVVFKTDSAEGKLPEESRQKGRGF